MSEALGKYSREQKLIFYFLFTNSVVFRDFFLPKVLKKRYKTRYYQFPPALSDNLVWAGARTVGKSLDLNIDIVQTSIRNPNMESLLSSYRKTHIKDRLEDVISYMTTVPFLKKFFKGDADKSLKWSVTRSPIYSIKLRNEHVITGISVGDDPNCVQIVGHHPQFRYLEETQDYPRAAWVKFQNTQAPEGSRDRFYGVPDGKIDTPFREMDSTIKKFHGKRFHISRRMEPNFTQEKKDDYRQSLGGENSNEFVTQVDAKWGEPTWGVWNEKDIMNNFDKGTGDIYSKRLHKVNVMRRDYVNLEPAEALHGLRPLPEDNLEVILGIDTGYTAPTVILPFFLWKGLWYLESMITLTDRMIPDDQAELIDYISDFYRATFILIDCSSAEGKAPASSLTNPKREGFKGKNYENRIIWVEFQKSEVIGFKKSDDKSIEDVTEKLKNHTTNILRTKFANIEFNLAYDEDILLEFNSESQKREGGRTTIKTPATVHIPEAFRCFAYGWWLAHSKIERPEFVEEMEEYDFMLPKYQNTEFKMFGRGGKKEEE